MNDLTEEEKKQKKKQAQRDAWQRWWHGPKGAIWREKRKKHQPEPEVAK